MLELSYLIQIPLQEKLFENIDELGQGGILLLVHLHQLHRLDPVHHVEADVHPHPGALVHHLDDGYTSLVQYLDR